MSTQKQLEGATKTDAGIILSGATMLPIIEQCEGCDRARAFDELIYCGSYPNPTRKWAEGRCNFATHIKKESTKAAKVNPLKASKRAAKGR